MHTLYFLIFWSIYSFCLGSTQRDSSQCLQSWNQGWSKAFSEESLYLGSRSRSLDIRSFTSADTLALSRTIKLIIVEFTFLRIILRSHYQIECLSVVFSFKRITLCQQIEDYDSKTPHIAFFIVWPYSWRNLRSTILSGTNTSS